MKNIFEKWKQKWKKNKTIKKGVLLFLPEENRYIRIIMNDSNSNHNYQYSVSGLKDSISVSEFKKTETSAFNKTNIANVFFDSKCSDYIENLDSFCTESLIMTGISTENYQVLKMYESDS